MKKEFFILLSAIMLCGASVLHSQQAAAPVPKNSAEALQALKTSNADLIEKQKKTLDTLDEMQKTADQLKAFGKRT